MASDPRNPFVWLDCPDSSIRRSLESYFAHWPRNCHDPEDLAEEVIGRLTKRLINDSTLQQMAMKERRLYVWGIARHVYQEWQRGPAAYEISLEREINPHPFFNALKGQHYKDPLQQMLEEDRVNVLEEVLEEALLICLNASDAELIRMTLKESSLPTLSELAKAHGIESAAMRKRKSRAMSRLQQCFLKSPRWNDVRHYWQIKVTGK